MATITHTYHRTAVIHVPAIKKSSAFAEHILPRPCMILSASTIIAGLGIPALMFAGLVPVTLFWAGVALALTAVGGVMALVFCGEI